MQKIPKPKKQIRKLNQNTALTCQKQQQKRKKRYQLLKGDPTTRPDIKRKFLKKKKRKTLEIPYKKKKEKLWKFHNEDKSNAASDLSFPVTAFMISLGPTRATMSC